MEQERLSMAKHEHALDVDAKEDDHSLADDAGATNGHAPHVADPIAFFRPTVTHAETAAYAKTQAIQGEPRSILAAWARTARMDLAALAIIPIGVGGALYAAFGLPVHYDRLLVLAIGALGIISAVNLLRTAAVASKRATPLEVVKTSLAAQVGVALFVVSLVCGIFVARWAGSAGVALGLLGIVLAGAYVAIAPVLGALPGEEAIPALALGPILFVLTLVTQASGKSGQGSNVHLSTAASHALSMSEALLAISLGCLMLAVVVARRLGEPAPAKGQTTRALLHRRGIRLLFIGSMVGAYVFAVAAGLGHGMPHATIAVLLSLPVAIVPLSGAMLARTDEALAVLRFGARRVALAFGGWLLGGLILGSVYLRFLDLLHNALKK
jgi:1,4-dihydroxy-2-naphthoate octaprenyltransferase